MGVVGGVGVVGAVSVQRQRRGESSNLAGVRTEDAFERAALSQSQALTQEITVRSARRGPDLAWTKSFFHARAVKTTTFIVCGSAVK